MNIIYHYYPRFRQPLFEAIAQAHPGTEFIYGANSRFGIAALAEDGHHLRRNLFLRNLIFQGFGLSTLRRVCRHDSIILGDLKFVNSWLYAILGRLCGRRILFWTHGVLKPETGLKWRLRKAYYNLANGLLLYSEHEAALMRDSGYHKPIDVVGNSNYHAADLLALEAVPSRSDKGLCYIGRISVEKGLVEFARFAARYPDRKVVLIGPTTPEIERYKGKDDNLIILEPEYDLLRLKQITADCGTLIMFTPAGLSLFTAMLLGKRVLIRRMFPQKPEYHLLQAQGLVEMFDDFDDLMDRAAEPDLDPAVFETARKQFLDENSAECVADRVVQAWAQHGKARS